MKVKYKGIAYKQEIKLLKREISKSVKKIICEKLRSVSYESIGCWGRSSWRILWSTII
jgi:hypothetical protein